MGITIKYLRGAAGIGLGTTINYLWRTAIAAVNQNADAGNNWATANIHKG